MRYAVFFIAAPALLCALALRGAEDKGGTAPAPPDKKGEAAKPAADEYQLVEPQVLKFSLKGHKYDSERTEEGIKPTGGTVGTFFCEGQKLELASDKFEDGFIVTKDYGKIKVRFTQGMMGAFMSVFLTPGQKGVLAALKTPAPK